jgi:carboxypeptidase D
MNPDGYEKTERFNAHGVDLNRNFPDQFETKEQHFTREAETLAVMKWVQSYPFVLSANLHGGSLVANYPFDDTKQQKGGYSKSPDDDVFKHVSLTYSMVSFFTK